MTTAMPCPVGSPQSSIPCSPPTDPTGFIYSSYRAAATDTHRDKAPLKVYPTYRAAQTETHRHKPSLDNSHQGVAYISSSVGGSVSTLSFEDTTIKNRLSPRKRRGGGIRARVRGFSRTSRRNLLRRLACINRAAFRAFKGRLISITLTYPHEYPEDPEVCKNHLKALRRRLQRKFGEFAGFWRMGIQKRGAWHFHLLLFVGPSIGSIGELRRFISSSWYEVTGKVSEGHLCAGTRVEAIRRWSEVTSYVERYMAREEEFPEGLQTGRIWGIWNPKLLPVRWETVEVSLWDAFRIRRIYRKLARRRGCGSLHSITVFVRYENVVRLLEYLGYRLE
jgi:hypothetical protein